MSTFSSLIKSGDTLNLVQLVSELESSLPMRRPYASDTVSASTTATSGAPATRLSTTISANADEIIICMGTVLVSHGTSAERISCRIYDSGTYSGIYPTWIASRSNTGGGDGQLTAFYVFENMTGTRTIKIEWWTSAGTAYSASTDLWLLVAKKRT